MKPSSIVGDAGMNPDTADAYDSSTNYDGSSAADGSMVDSSSAQYIGPGQYDENLVWHSDSIDDSDDTADRTVILSELEWKKAWIVKTWADSNSLTPITVT